MINNDDNYFSLKRVSAHLLKIFKTSVVEYVNRLNNPEQEKKKFLELGKQIHMSLLEPKKFNETYLLSDFDTELTPATLQQKEFCYAVAPHNPSVDEETATKVYQTTYKTERKSPKKVEEEALSLYTRFKPYIDYLREINTGKVVLPKNLAESLNTAKTTVLKHKKAFELLNIPEIEFADDTAKAYNELTILWEYKVEEGKLECKSRPDRIIVDTKNKVIKLVDVKTASSFTDFADTIKNYGYDIQLSFYWGAIMYWFKQEFKDEDITQYKQETYIVAYKTVGVPECKVISFSEDFLLKAAEQIVSLMRDLNWHTVNNKWEYSRSYYEGDGIEIIQ
jgi:hypothetical protein